MSLRSDYELRNGQEEEEYGFIMRLWQKKAEETTYISIPWPLQSELLLGQNFVNYISHFSVRKNMIPVVNRAALYSMPAS